VGDERTLIIRLKRRILECRDGKKRKRVNSNIERRGNEV